MQLSRLFLMAFPSLCVNINSILDVSLLTLKGEPLMNLSTAGDYYDLGVDFTRAIQLNPYFAEAYTNSGNVYADLRKYDLAIIDYNIALEIKQHEMNWRSRIIKKLFNSTRMIRERILIAD